jgi:microsomal epoxide hydrolase
MAADYATVPITALNKPEPYHIEIPEEQLRDFKSLLGLSRVVAPTYESLQEDGRFGVDHKWMTETKKYWEHEFDWQVSPLSFHQCDHLLFLTRQQ